MHLSKPITLRPLWAAFIPFAAVAAQAQVTTSMTARGTSTLNGKPPLSQTSSYPGSNPVDVQDYQFELLNDDDVSRLILHAHGSTSGNFGSMSSGSGIYDATSSFQIVQTITNVGSVPANALFNFYITPGFLQNDVRSVLSGSQYVTSGISFDIQRNGTSVWGSAATLTTNASGTDFTRTGANLYASSADNPTYYAIDGSHQTVDLGVLNAGESIELMYTLSTFANGSALGGPELTISDRTYVVPEQWIDFRVYGYGCRDYLPVPMFPFAGPCPILWPGETILIPGFTLPGYGSGSTASSGDPFGIRFDNEPYSDGNVDFERIGSAANIGGPPTVRFVPTSAVPEPETYALTLSGLGVLAMVARRQRRRFRLMA